MLNVGLTGGIACGKSTVGRMFIRHGAHLIDFDQLAHNVEKQGQPAWEKIVQYFGESILLPDKNIDRYKLAQIVFADSQKLKTLNGIVHPYVSNEWKTLLEKTEKKEKNAIILSDVPLLFEEKMQHLFDLTLLVLISPAEQIQRLITRNDLSRDEAKRRLMNQMPIGEKARLADIVIDNQKTVAETEKKVEEVWQKLLKIEKNKTQHKSRKKT
jgi:dephospho-CoA kinase